MTNIPSGQPADSSPSRRRYSHSRRSKARLRRQRAAALAVRAVAANLSEGAVAPALPPAGVFVRRDTLLPEEVQQLFAACSTTTRLGLHDRAMLAASYYACLRSRELLLVDVDDFDAAAGTLTVRAGQYNGTRVISLPPIAVEFIDAWAQRRRRLRNPGLYTGLFCTLGAGERPRPLTEAQIRDTLKRLALAARVSKQPPIDCNRLRVARARELALAGVGLPEIADLLDHMREKTNKTGLRVNLDATRKLISEVAPQAPCVGYYAARELSAVTQSEYRLGQKPANAGMKLPPEVLDPEDIKAMLATFPKRGPLGARNRAIVTVLWRAGLRIAELLALEIRDVDLKHGLLVVRHGKGDKRRVVGIDPDVVPVIKRWLGEREALGLASDRGPLFCVILLPNRGRPLGQSNVREMLKTAAAGAGLSKRVHPHGFRHTHAFELSQEGVPLPIIQKQLGHNDLATTALYIDHLLPKQVIDAMQQRRWAA